MWKWRSLRSTAGSTSDQRERLIRALEEQNALMRLQLEMAGVKVTLPTIRPTGTIRKRTAADVTVMTADMVIEEARKQAEQAALPADAQTAPQS